MRIQSEGIISYRIGDDKLFRVVVLVEKDIVALARSLVPKYIRLSPQKYDPHVTVLRESAIPRASKWLAHQGKLAPFAYDPEIQVGDVYFWLNVYSSYLEELRVELGLERIGPGARPPDESDNFHTTIGNRKSG